MKSITNKQAREIAMTANGAFSFYGPGFSQLTKLYRDAAPFYAFQAITLNTLPDWS